MEIFSKLNILTKKLQSNICIGLDPIPNYMPIENIFEFNRSIVDKTYDLVVAYKPQFAFYEAFGFEGLKALEETIRYIRSLSKDIIIIGDGKRGDIDSTSAAYAKSYFKFWGVDIATVNPYMGIDSILPFLEYENKGIYVICRTSNPGSKDFQDLETSSGEKIYELVASKCADISSNGNLGFVIGATYPDEIRNLREQFPQRSFLIPGIGTQKGDLKSSVDVAKNVNNSGFLINSSRSIIYASKDPKRFSNIAREKTLELKNQINDVLISG